MGHRGTKNSRLFLAPFCAGMIEYYAFEADKPTEAALFAYRKFAKMGIEQWIRSITGWTPPQVESAEDPKIILPNCLLLAIVSTCISTTLANSVNAHASPRFASTSRLATPLSTKLLASSKTLTYYQIG